MIYQYCQAGNCYSKDMLRSTRQRTAIREVFEKTGRPLSTEEVLKAAKKQVPGLGIATVYRAVKGFLEEGDLVTVAIPGEPPRYELAGKRHHHHFHCTACGKVFELEGCPGDLSHLAPKGFRLEDHELLLYGRCTRCLKA